jgi:hypothetical protein
MAPKISRSWWMSGLAVIGAIVAVVTVALSHRVGADDVDCAREVCGVYLR